MSTELKNKIDTDFKAAMKAKSPEYPIISFLRAAIKQVEVDSRKEMTDEEVVAVVQREVKKRKDSITEYEKGGRPDLAQKEAEEVRVISRYLPAQMSENDIKKIIKETLAEMGPVDPSKMGQVLGKVMPKVKGKAEGSLVNKIVKDLLTV
ncbi:GatB/YqeY domain-containing protein [Candidatus Uhrbacteria bacterium]|nr:GatB/YqeY domain-containing protein [Candidatus Uhrbacteria bacterium]